MTFVEMGHTGASKQSWRSPSPRALLKSLMDEAKEKGWTVIGMKDDWKSIFADGIAKAR